MDLLSYPLPSRAVSCFCCSSRHRSLSAEGNRVRESLRIERCVFAAASWFINSHVPCIQTGARELNILYLLPFRVLRIIISFVLLSLSAYNVVAARNQSLGVLICLVLFYVTLSFLHCDVPLIPLTDTCSCRSTLQCSPLSHSPLLLLIGGPVQLNTSLFSISSPSLSTHVIFYNHSSYFPRRKTRPLQGALLNGPVSGSWQ